MLSAKFFLRNYLWPNGMAEAQQSLLAGRHRHDVIEAALNSIEDDPTIETVGYGGYPNLLGEMELDAAFMDGNDRMLGAIAAIKNFGHPSSIARRLMEAGLHTMLCGEGAEIFAREHGFQPQSMLSAKVEKRWRSLVEPLLSSQAKTTMLDKVRDLRWPDKEESSVKHDTAAMIASDGGGISAGTSTAGWAAKHPGRVGDSPLCGAGFYVDTKWGACVCTHTGEVAMRAGTARLVVAQLAAGNSLHEAVDAAVEDLTALKSGQLGGLVIHAVNADGQARVVAVNVDSPVRYWHWHQDFPQPECLAAESITY